VFGAQPDAARNLALVTARDSSGRAGYGCQPRGRHYEPVLMCNRARNDGKRKTLFNRSGILWIEDRKTLQPAIKQLRHGMRNMYDFYA
jgi:hypothetical protein